MDSQVKTIEFLHLLPKMRNQIYHHVSGNHEVIRVPPQSTIPSRRLEHDSETTGWHVLEKVQDYMTHICLYQVRQSLSARLQKIGIWQTRIETARPDMVYGDSTNKQR
jgi:hypothetical protein